MDKEEVRIEYCNTEIMLADYFTKPLKGKLFHKFWDVIMGYKHIKTLKQDNHNYENKERVEKSNENIFAKCEKKQKSKNNQMPNKRVHFTEPPYTYTKDIQNTSIGNSIGNTNLYKKLM